MKVLFLDIDGVLNADDTRIHIDGPKKGKRKSSAPSCCGFTGIDRSKVQLLQAIIQATDAKIVLVSTWKDCYEYFNGNSAPTLDNPDSLPTTSLRSLGKYLHNKLSDFHLHIYSTTYLDEQQARLHGAHHLRGAGIAHWLADHSKEDITSRIALDDEAWDYLPDQLPHLVQTDPFLDPHDQSSWGPRGLTPLEVEKAITLLNSASSSSSSSAPHNP